MHLQDYQCADPSSSLSFSPGQNRPPFGGLPGGFPAIAGIPQDGPKTVGFALLGNTHQITTPPPLIKPHSYGV